MTQPEILNGPSEFSLVLGALFNFLSADMNV